MYQLLNLLNQCTPPIDGGAYPPPGADCVTGISLVSFTARPDASETGALFIAGLLLLTLINLIVSKRRES